jgi:hypothetical protein
MYRCTAVGPAFKESRILGAAGNLAMDTDSEQVLSCISHPGLPKVTLNKPVDTAGTGRRYLTRSSGPPGQLACSKNPSAPRPATCVDATLLQRPLQVTKTQS